MMNGQAHSALAQRLGQHTAEAASRTGDECDSPEQLHQGGLAAPAEMARISPVTAAGPEVARDIPPSVMSASSTYAAVSPEAATLSPVRTMAGATALTRICRSLSSSARLRVKPATAALAAEYSAI